MPNDRAFPTPAVLTEQGKILDCKPGMTLAAYFAAHAPAEIPPWFTAPIVRMRGPRPDPAEYFKTNDGARRMASEWTRDPIYDLEEALREAHGEYCAEVGQDFSIAMHAWWDEGQQADNDNKAAAYFAWRRHYGERMAAEMAR